MLTSTNHATGEIMATFPELTPEEIETKLGLATEVYKTWRDTTIAERARKMVTLAALLWQNASEIGHLATLEMGKPIRQARAEVEKCALVCEYYAAEAAKILAPEIVPTEAQKSFVQFDSLGPILAVMPWNFPFWQVIRFAAPALMAGNVGLLKHASNVSQCGQKIEELFAEAGFPVGVFQYLRVGSGAVENLIKDERIKALTLTGSEGAGRAVAKAAGENLKKIVLELGGSDAFIVLSDADLAKAAKVGALARLQNAGQSCIAAKRFIVVAEVKEKFVELLTREFASFVVGNPEDENTQMGPLVNLSAVTEIKRQVTDSLNLGARLICGGEKLDLPGAFFAPTILTDVKPGMPAYNEEIFGPVAGVIVAKDEADAIRIANDSRFGLGASLWTADLARAQNLAGKIESGAVFVNEMVKSDPRLPFGGSKASGYGRELGSYGLREFVNVKTVWINEA